MEENLKVVDIEKKKEEKIKENTARDTEAVLKEYEDTLKVSDFYSLPFVKAEVKKKEETELKIWWKIIV